MTCSEYVELSTLMHQLPLSRTVPVALLTAAWMLVKSAAPYLRTVLTVPGTPLQERAAAPTLASGQSITPLGSAKSCS